MAPTLNTQTMPVADWGKEMPARNGVNKEVFSLWENMPYDFSFTIMFYYNYCLLWPSMSSHGGRGAVYLRVWGSWIHELAPCAAQRLYSSDHHHHLMSNKKVFTACMCLTMVSKESTYIYVQSGSLTFLIFGCAIICGAISFSNLSLRRHFSRGLICKCACVEWVDLIFRRVWYGGPTGTCQAPANVDSRMSSGFWGSLTHLWFIRMHHFIN